MVTKILLKTRELTRLIGMMMSCERAVGNILAVEQEEIRKMDEWTSGWAGKGEGERKTKSAPFFSSLKNTKCPLTGIYNWICLF